MWGPSSAAIVGLSLVLIAATAAAAKPCLTKEQARKLWPSEWLYWHTERHCWDRIKGTSGTYNEQARTAAIKSTSQMASAASSSERTNLMMRRRITADIQRSQRGFTLRLMTPMAFSIRLVAPSPRCVYRHVLCHQSTAMAFSIRRVASSPRCVYRHILCHQSAQHAVDLCRDTVARSQVLFRARRSTSTRFHSTYISPHASRPSR